MEEKIKIHLEEALLTKRADKLAVGFLRQVQPHSLSANETSLDKCLGSRLFKTFDSLEPGQWEETGAIKRRKSITKDAMKISGKTEFEMSLTL